MAISNIQLVVVFHLVATLYDNGETPDVMVRLEDTFVLLTIPHPIFEANYTKVSKVDVPPNSLKYSNVSPKVKTKEKEEGVGACSLTRNNFRVRRVC
jgi:hypothetical protein